MKIEDIPAVEMQITAPVAVIRKLNSLYGRTDPGSRANYWKLREDVRNKALRGAPGYSIRIL